MANANDTFTDADSTLLQNHTSDSGHSWTRHPSFAANVTITSNQIGGSTIRYYISAVPASAEYDVQLDNITTNASTVTMGPAGRIDSAANTAYRVLWHGGAGNWQLRKHVAGTSTTLGTYAGDSPVGTARTAKLEIRTAAKKVYVDTVERISSSDDSITATGYGGVSECDNAANRADNFVLTDVAGGGVVLAGSFDAVSNITGATGVARNIAGIIASASTIDGVPSVSRSIIGLISAQSDISGASSVARNLAGPIDAVSDISGIAQVARNISGSIDSVSNITGGILVARGLAGFIDAVSSLSGTLITGEVLLIGSIDAVSSITGNTIISRQLAGIIAALSDITGDAKIARALAGSIVSSATITADMSRALQFAGTIDSLSSIIGDLQTSLNQIIIIADRRVFKLDTDRRVFKLDTDRRVFTIH